MATEIQSQTPSEDTGLKQSMIMLGVLVLGVVVAAFFYY